MTAILILVVAAVLAFAWFKVVDRMTGEEVMGCGIFLLVPLLLIVIGTIIALIMLT